MAIPAECRVDPAEPLETDPPNLPPLPDPGSPDYEAARAARAELAALYALDVADEERTTRRLNASTQGACAEWARRRDAGREQ